MKQEYSIDRILVKKILEGNSIVFKNIIANTQGLVIQIIYKMIKNPKDREDLAQEVYLKVFNNLSGFKFNSKLSTWVGTITYNTCLNFLEKKKIPILNVIDEEGNELWNVIENNITDNIQNQTEDYILKKERSHILQLEIEKLPPLYKTIVTLFHNEELSYEEISKITDLPEGTIKSYLFRARKKLRESLLNTYKKSDL